MPWRLAASVGPYTDDPTSCPECAGDPRLEDGQCGTCGAALVARDPRPGEFVTTTIIPVDAEGRPAPSRRRRFIRIQDGWKRQSDGRLAKVFRRIDKVSNVYIERVEIDGMLVREVNEPLTAHRGHGSAKTRRDDR